MNKLKVVLSLFIVFVVLFPIVSSSKLSIEDNLSLDSTNVTCSIEGNRVTKELTSDQIGNLMDLAESLQDSFLVIYNPFSSDLETEQAFNEIQPFFEILIDLELTEKSTDDLNMLYSSVRNKVRVRDTGKGLWNGVPTPVMCNLACGVVAVGAAAVGYAIGTHTVLPTLGLDVLVTAEFTGESSTVGLFGWTQQALLQTFIVFGFVGILLGVWPSGVILGSIFMTGFAVLAGTIGLTPF